MRPKKFYVIFDHGKAVHICEGLVEAKLHVEALLLHGGNAGYRACRTRESAELFVSWHNYEREQYKDARARKRINELS